MTPEETVSALPDGDEAATSAPSLLAFPDWLEQNQAAIKEPLQKYRGYSDYVKQETLAQGRYSDTLVQKLDTKLAGLAVESGDYALPEGATEYNPADVLARPRSEEIPAKSILNFAYSTDVADDDPLRPAAAKYEAVRRLADEGRATPEQVAAAMAELGQLATPELLSRATRKDVTEGRSLAAIVPPADPNGAPTVEINDSLLDFVNPDGTVDEPALGKALKMHNTDASLIPAIRAKLSRPPGYAKTAAEIEKHGEAMSTLDTLARTSSDDRFAVFEELGRIANSRERGNSYATEFGAFNLRRAMGEQAKGKSDEELLTLADDFNNMNAMPELDEADPAKALRTLSTGQVVAPLPLMLNDAAFEKAVNDPSVPLAQRDHIRLQRDYAVEASASDIIRTIADNPQGGDEFVAYMDAQRAEKKTDAEIVKGWIGMGKFSTTKSTLAGLRSSLGEAVMPYVALATGADPDGFAIRAMQGMKIEDANRRAYADLFGKPHGMAYDLGLIVAPVAVDLGAAFLTRGVATGAVAVGKATAGTAVRNVMKTALTAPTRTFVQSWVKAGAASTAKGMGVKLTGRETADEVVSMAGRDIVSKIATGTAYATSMATGFNRSALSTYASLSTALSNQTNPDGTPKYTQEEVREIAMTHGLAAGTITAGVMAGFFGLGAPGMEMVLRKGLTNGQYARVMGRLRKETGAMKVGDEVANTNAMIAEFVKQGVRPLFNTATTAGKIKAFASAIPTPVQGALQEGAEEGLDEFMQYFNEARAMGDRISIADAAKQAMYAASLGGVMGSTIAGVGTAIKDRTTPSPRVEADIRRERLLEMAAKLESTAPQTAQVFRNYAFQQRALIPQRQQLESDLKAAKTPEAKAEIKAKIDTLNEQSTKSRTDELDITTQENLPEADAAEGDVSEGVDEGMAPEGEAVEGGTPEGSAAGGVGVEFPQPDFTYDTQPDPNKSAEENQANAREMRARLAGYKTKFAEWAQSVAVPDEDIEFDIEIVNPLSEESKKATYTLRVGDDGSTTISVKAHSGGGQVRKASGIDFLPKMGSDINPKTMEATAARPSPHFVITSAPRIVGANRSKRTMAEGTPEGSAAGSPNLVETRRKLGGFTGTPVAQRMRATRETVETEFAELVEESQPSSEQSNLATTGEPAIESPTAPTADQSPSPTDSLPEGQVAPVADTGATPPPAYKGRVKTEFSKGVQSGEAEVQPIEGITQNMLNRMGSENIRKANEASREVRSVDKDNTIPAYWHGWTQGRVNTKSPVGVEAVDTYGIKLPEGYVKQGDLYIHQPTPSTTLPGLTMPPRKRNSLSSMRDATVDKLSAVETRLARESDPENLRVLEAGKARLVKLRDQITEVLETEAQEARAQVFKPDGEMYPSADPEAVVTIAEAQDVPVVEVVRRAQEPSNAEYQAMLLQDRKNQLADAKKQLSELTKQYGTKGEKSVQSKQLGGLNPIALEIRGLRVRIAELTRLTEGDKPKVVKPTMTAIQGVNVKGTREGLIYNAAFGNTRAQIGKDRQGWYVVTPDLNVVVDGEKSAAEALKKWAASQEITYEQIGRIETTAGNAQGGTQTGATPGGREGGSSGVPTGTNAAGLGALQTDRRGGEQGQGGVGEPAQPITGGTASGVGNVLTPGTPITFTATTPPGYTQPTQGTVDRVENGRVFARVGRTVIPGVTVIESAPPTIADLLVELPEGYPLDRDTAKLVSAAVAMPGGLVSALNSNKYVVQAVRKYAASKGIATEGMNATDLAIVVGGELEADSVLAALRGEGVAVAAPVSTDITIVDNPDGTFTVGGRLAKQIKIGGDTRWQVQTEENRLKAERGERQIGGDLLFNTREEAIEQTRAEIMRERANAETKVKADAAQAAKDATETERLKPLAAFTEGMTPMQRGKAEKTLRDEWHKKSAATGKVYRGEKFGVIREMIGDGYRPVQYDSKYRFEREDGSGFDLNKTDFNYANWVLENPETPTDTPRNLPSSTPSSVVTAELNKFGFSEGLPTFLANVAKRGQKQHRALAKLLLDVGAGGVPVDLADLPNSFFAGQFQASTGRITVNTAKEGPRGTVDTVLHELVHATTEQSLRRPTEAQAKVIARIERVRRTIIKRSRQNGIYSGDIKYATGDNAEFLTHFFTSQRFRDQVSAMTPKSEKNWLQVIADLIADLFTGRTKAQKMEAELRKELTTLITAPRIGLAPSDVIMRLPAENAEPDFAAAEQKFNNQVNEYVTGNWPSGTEGRYAELMSFAGQWAATYTGVPVTVIQDTETTSRLRISDTDITRVELRGGNAFRTSQVEGITEAEAKRLIANEVNEEVIHYLHFEAVRKRIGTGATDSEVATEIRSTYLEMFNHPDAAVRKEFVRYAYESYITYTKQEPDADTAENPEPLMRYMMLGNPDYPYVAYLAAYEAVRQIVQARSFGTTTEARFVAFGERTIQWFKDRLAAIRSYASRTKVLSNHMERDIIETERALNALRSDIRFQPTSDARNVARFHQLTESLYRGRDEATAAEIETWKAENPEKWEELSAMREEVLRAGGWDVKAYHGSNALARNEFTVFSVSKGASPGFWFSSNREWSSYHGLINNVFLRNPIVLGDDFSIPENRPEDIKSAEPISPGKKLTPDRWADAASPDIRFQPAVGNTDAEYLAAVEAGDMETAQRMVDDAATRAGYQTVLHHGTPKDLPDIIDRKAGNNFWEDFESWGIWTTQQKSAAAHYGDPKTFYADPGESLIYRGENAWAEWAKDFAEIAYPGVSIPEGSDARAIRKIVSEFLDSKAAEFNKGKTKDAQIPTHGFSPKGRDWIAANFPGADGYNQYLKDNGYGSVQMRNAMVDGREQNITVVLESNQLKSDAPVTYEETEITNADGTVSVRKTPIPLSQRFQSTSPDIRFQGLTEQDFTPASLRDTATGFLPDDVTLNDLTIDFADLADITEGLDPVNAENAVHAAVNHALARRAGEAAIPAPVRDGFDSDEAFDAATAEHAAEVARLTDTFELITRGRLTSEAMFRYRTNPNALQRLVDYLTAAIKAAYARFTARYDTATAVALNRMSRDLAKARTGFNHDIEPSRGYDAEAVMMLPAADQDAEYLAAVEAGDMETAQRMVDEAARAAGYDTTPIFRGRQRFTEIIKSTAAYFAYSRESAQAYAEEYGGEDGVVLKAYAKFRNTASEKQVVEVANRIKHEFTDESVPSAYLDVSPELLDALKEAGYDSVSGRDSLPDDQGSISVIAALYPQTQIKSADPVTRDDAGNVIPLSQRFDTQSPDIRFLPAAGNMDAEYLADRSLFQSEGLTVVEGEPQYDETSTNSVMLKKGDDIIAFIDLMPLPTGEVGIGQITVDENFRRKGLASALFREARRIEPKLIFHGYDYTDDGRAFAESFLTTSPDIRFLPAAQPASPALTPQERTRLENELLNRGAKVDFLSVLYKDDIGTTASVNKLESENKFIRRIREMFVNTHGKLSVSHAKAEKNKDAAINTVKDMMERLRNNFLEAARREDVDMTVVQIAMGNVDPPLTPDMEKKITDDFIAEVKASEEEIKATYEQEKLTNPLKAKDNYDDALVIANAEADRNRKKAIWTAQGIEAEKRKVQQLEAFIQLERTAPDTAEVVKEIRGSLNQFQRLAKEVNKSNPEILAIIDQTFGIYLVRSFGIHQDPKQIDLMLHSEDPFYKERKDALVNFFMPMAEEEIVRQYRQDPDFMKTLPVGLDEDAVIDTITTRFQSQINERALLKFEDFMLARVPSSGPFAEGSTVANEIQRYMKKSNMPQEFLDALMVNEDPIFNAMNTMMSLGRLVFHSRMLNEIHDSGIEAGQFITEAERASGITYADGKNEMRRVFGVDGTNENIKAHVVKTLTNELMRIAKSQYANGVLDAMPDRDTVKQQAEKAMKDFASAPTVSLADLLPQLGRSADRFATDAFISYDQKPIEVLNNLQPRPGRFSGWQPVFTSNKGNSAFAPLGGLYAEPEYVKAMQATFKVNSKGVGHFSDDFMGQAHRYVVGAAGASLGIITQGNPSFYTRNILGNTVTGAMSAVTPFHPKKVALAMRTIRGMMSTKGEITNEMIELIAGRIILDAPQIGLIKQLIEDVMENPAAAMEDLTSESALADIKAGKLAKGSRKAAKAFIKRIGKFSEASEAFSKIMVYADFKDILTEANWGSELEIYREASRLTNEVMPARSETPTLVDSFTRSGFGALVSPFLRFRVDIIRCTVNSFKLANEWRQSDNPVLRKHGQIKTAAWFGTVGVLTVGFPLIMRSIFGFDDEDDRYVRAANPAYNKDASLIYFRQKDENGNVIGLNTINVTFTNPLASFGDPLSRIVNAVISREPSEIPGIMGRYFVGDVLGENIVAGAVIDTWRNRDSNSGLPIYLEGESDIDKAIKKAMHIGKAYTPKIGTQAYKFVQALRREEDDLPWNQPQGVLFATFAPFTNRATTFDDMDKSIFRRIHRDTAELSALTFKSTSRAPLNPGQIADMFEKRQQLRIQQAKLLRDHMERSANIRGGGDNMRDVVRNAINAGNSRKSVGLLINQNVVERIQPPKEQLRKMEDISPVRPDEFREWQRQYPTKIPLD